MFLIDFFLWLTIGDIRLRFRIEKATPQLSHIVPGKSNMRNLYWCFLPILSSTVRASYRLTLFEGHDSKLAVAVSIVTETGDTVSDSLFLNIDPTSSVSYMYKSRDCSPFVKCFNGSISESYILQALNTEKSSESVVDTGLGLHTFSQGSYTGSLMETAGVSGFGPLSEVARKYRVKFSSDSRSRVELIPRDRPFDYDHGSFTRLPICESASGYGMPAGSSISFSVSPGGSVVSTDSTIPIIFDPTEEYSIFPESIIMGLLESVKDQAATRSRNGPLVGVFQTGQLIIPSNLGFIPGFNLTLPDNTSLVLSDGIEKFVVGSRGGLLGSTNMITDYKVSSEANQIIIGRSILKKSIKSIILDGDDNVILEHGRGAISANDQPLPLPHDYPASAGINFGFNARDFSIEPPSSIPLVYARPYIGSEFLVQNKYFLHTFTPIPIMFQDTLARGYILNCVEFLQTDFQGPEITRIPHLFQFDSRISRDGRAQFSTESGVITFPIIKADEASATDVFKIILVKTETEILLILVNQEM